MPIISDILEKDLGYNRRERISIYAGTALGFIAPIALGRYLIPEIVDNNALNECIAWGASFAANVLPSIFSGVPLLYTTAVGAGLGIRRAEYLQRRRLERNKGIENLVQPS